jgi:hypothetical protein
VKAVPVRSNKLILADWKIDVLYAALENGEKLSHPKGFIALSEKTASPPVPISLSYLKPVAGIKKEKLFTAAPKTRFPTVPLESDDDGTAARS